MSYTLKFLTELLHNNRIRNFLTTEYDPFICLFTNDHDFTEQEMAFRMIDETLLIYLINRLKDKEYIGKVYCIPYQQIIHISFIPCPELVLIPFTGKEFEELVHTAIT